MDDEAWPWGCHEHRGVKDNASCTVEKLDMEVVVGDRTLALGDDVGADRLRRPKELECLIEEVWTEIVPDAATRASLLTPALTYLGAVAIEVGLEVDDLAQRTLPDQGAQGEKIGIPTAVVEDR